MDDNLEALPLSGAIQSKARFVGGFGLLEYARYLVANSSSLEETAIGQRGIVRGWRC